MPTVIAEIGCNHKGDFAVAKEMVKTAICFCNVDIVKFQKRDNALVLTHAQRDAAHPEPEKSYGATYGAHREALEFTLDQHRELQQLCRQYGADYACSVWDTNSALDIASLKPPYIKIPSATNLNRRLLDVLLNAYKGPIHVSVGMTTDDEIEHLVRYLESHKRADDLILYACTSGYPVRFDELCLLEIVKLRERYAGRVKAIGFSGHHLGIAADVAALALGAEYIERHFTMDRTWKGSDHAASLEPDGMRRLCRDLRAVAEALQYKPEQMLATEQAQRTKLKWEPGRAE